MLRLVCLCLGLLWLPRRVAAGAVVAALIPGLAVLFALAPTRVGQFDYPCGLWAWLHVTRLPSLAAGASTWVSQGRCGQPGAHATVGDGRARVST